MGEDDLRHQILPLVQRIVFAKSRPERLFGKMNGPISNCLTYCPKILKFDGISQSNRSSKQIVTFSQLLGLGIPWAANRVSETRVDLLSVASWLISYSPLWDGEDLPILWSNPGKLAIAIQVGNVTIQNVILSLLPLRTESRQISDKLWKDMHFRIGFSTVIIRQTACLYSIKS